MIAIQATSQKAGDKEAINFVYRTSTCMNLSVSCLCEIILIVYSVLKQSDDDAENGSLGSDGGMRGGTYAGFPQKSDNKIP